MIIVKDVKKSYKDVHALKGVDLHVPKGKIKALLGPNGAGKTTLVHIMTTLLQADSGEVTIAGLDAFKQKKELRSKMGLTGQYAAVDEDLTGYENLVMFGRLYHLPAVEAKKRATELLGQFHLADAGDWLSKTYSGGMRRRLDLAASLIVHPPVLFLDEPTSGLDPASRLDLWNIIRKLVEEGTTVLLTTQYLEEADQLADTISIIHKGEIIAEGTPDELKDSSGGNVLEVTIDESKQMDAAEKIITALSPYDIDADPEHRHFRMPIDEGASVVVKAVRELDAANIKIDDIQLHRPTLDDVFIGLTGETL